MDYVPPSSGGAPTSLDSGDRPVQPPQGGLAGKSQLIPVASQGFRGDANRLALSPRVQFDIFIKHWIKGGKVERPPRPRHDPDEAGSNVGLIVQYRSTRPDNSHLGTVELGCKALTLFAVSV